MKKVCVTLCIAFFVIIVVGCNIVDDANSVEISTLLPTNTIKPIDNTSVIEETSGTPIENTVMTEETEKTNSSAEVGNTGMSAVTDEIVITPITIVENTMSLETTPIATVKPASSNTVTTKPTATIKPTVKSSAIAKPTTTVKPTIEPTAKPTSTATSKPTPTIKPTITVKPTPTVKPDIWTYVFRDDIAAQIEVKINAHRIQNGVKALIFDEYSKLQAEEQLLYNFVQKRYMTDDAANHSGGQIGTAVRGGFEDVASRAFNNWKNSSGHNFNMLDNRMHYYGAKVMEVRKNEVVVEYMCMVGLINEGFIGFDFPEQ